MGPFDVLDVEKMNDAKDNHAAKLSGWFAKRGILSSNLLGLYNFFVTRITGVNGYIGNTELLTLILSRKGKAFDSFFNVGGRVWSNRKIYKIGDLKVRLVRQWAQSYIEDQSELK